MLAAAICKKPSRLVIFVEDFPRVERTRQVCEKEKQQRGEKKPQGTDRELFNQREPGPRSSGRRNIYRVTRNIPVIIFEQLISVAAPV